MAKINRSKEKIARVLYERTNLNKKILTIQKSWEEADKTLETVKKQWEEKLKKKKKKEEKDA